MLEVQCSMLDIHTPFIICKIVTIKGIVILTNWRNILKQLKLSCHYDNINEIQ